MQYYISKNFKKIVTRNNGIANVHPKLFNHTQDDIEFSIVDSQNQLQNIPSGSLYFSASYKSKKGNELILLCDDYEVNDKIIKFNYSTNSYEFLNLIQGDNVEVNLEIGVINGTSQQVILSDFGYASQRYYIDGMPEPRNLNAYYTKTEISGILSAYATQEWVIEKISEIGGVTKSYVDGQDSYLSGQIDLKASNASLTAHTDNNDIHVTSTDKTNWNGKQNAITSTEKLDYALISGTPIIPLSTSQLLNDSDYQNGTQVGNAITTSISGKADTTALTAHTNDNDIHVTSTDKTNWNGKQNAITSTEKLDYALISGTPIIPLSTSQLLNDSDYQNGTQVGNAITTSISGKADTTALTAHTNDNDIHVTSNDKTNWNNKITNPSGGTTGQVLKKTANGVEWSDDITNNPVNVSLEYKDCLIAGMFTCDFTGKQIQKYNSTNATSGTITINCTTFVSSATDIAPTIELQIPINGKVTTITIPSNVNVIDMPEELEYETDTITYHDLVLRAEKDVNGVWQYYINYAYKFTEELA